MNVSYFLIGSLICLGSLGMGAVAYERWLGHVVSARKKQARQHPLRRKPLSSKDELQVWRWLEGAFPDQHVLLKMPLTSFTEPNNLDGDAHWQALLSAVNFSCAVCNAQGTVLGCVDVLTRGERPDRGHALKRELLGRAGIAYWIVENRIRPDTALIRAKFLSFVPHADQKRRKPSRSHKAAAGRLHFTRMASGASALTQTGITPGQLKSSLSMASIANALAARFAPARGREQGPFHLTGDSAV